MRREKKKSELLMDVFWCVFFLWSSPPRLSSVSVVFDFNASLNDAAPVSVMLFTVGVMRKKRSGLFDGCLVCVFFFCLHCPY